jgi:two-component system sensor histidine kinase UhpB
LLEERARIMRDMHDGIGGQLLGLVMRARANRLSGPALVHGLEESLDDLRLMVGSLEQSDGSLATALGAYRARIEPRCEAAGAELVWRIENVGETPGFGPDRTLQVYRILQEACTNALKHGHPDRIEVTLRRRHEGGVTLSLEDNGAGFDLTSVTAGRGLANMRHRAGANWRGPGHPVGSGRVANRTAHEGRGRTSLTADSRLFIPWTSGGAPGWRRRVSAQEDRVSPVGSPAQSAG